MQATELAPFVPAPREDVATVRVYGPGDVLLDWSTTDYPLGTANYFAGQYAQQLSHIDLVAVDGSHHLLISRDGK